MQRRFLGQLPHSVHLNLRYFNPFLDVFSKNGITLPSGQVYTSRSESYTNLSFLYPLSLVLLLLLVAVGWKVPEREISVEKESAVGMSLEGPRNAKKKIPQE